MVMYWSTQPFGGKALALYTSVRNDNLTRPKMMKFVAQIVDKYTQATHYDDVCWCYEAAGI
jgi:hypothetical protein